MACSIIFFSLSALLLVLLPVAAPDSPHSGRALLPSFASRCPTVPNTLPASTLKVLVPNRTSFKEFVDCSDPSSVTGFSVDVFKFAMSVMMPRNVSYFCFDLNPGQSSGHATYNDLVNCLSEGSFDAVVGDVTIASNRLETASFTQPYSDSGIAILAPMVGQPNRFPGVFLAPFTPQMWGTVLASVVATGIVLWLLEQNMHHPKQHLRETLWFLVSLLIFFKRDNLRNKLAKVVLVVWIAFILVLGSAYTAALTAILTVRNLAPHKLNISIVQKELTWGVGYQKGSIVHEFLNGTLLIPDHRFLILNSPEDFVDALSKGPYIKNNGVAVIVEEVPYLNVFLSNLPAANCNYAILPPKLTSAGFGFAFPHGSNLSEDFSMAVLNLSESGDLQRLKTGSQINNFECPSHIQSTQLDLISSEGLFLLLALALLVCIVLFVAKLLPRRLQSFASIRNWARVQSVGDGGYDSDFEDSVYRRERSSDSSRSRHLTSSEMASNLL